jgi:hypothetical protein
LNRLVFLLKRIVCAQFGQCGGAGFDPLVFSLSMKRTPQLGVSLAIGRNGESASYLIVQSTRLR